MANILGDRGPGPDTEPEVPKGGFEAFKGTTPAIILGGALAIVITFALFYTNIYASCCGFGFFLVALVLYYIPKLFGTKKLLPYIVIGVVFFLLITSIGAFLVSKDYVNSVSLDDGENAGQKWDNVQFIDSEDKITVDYNGDEWRGGRHAYIYVTKVDKVCYNGIMGGFSKDNRHESVSKEDNTFTFDNLGMTKGNLYAFEFQITEMDGNDEKSKSTSYVHLYKGYASEDDIQNVTLVGNAYWVGICAITYFVLVVLMHFMNLYLDKTRARLEAEGRLYPQGYGRCKECGTVVLPGETCCRKCGAYVDIPDEMRVKKVDSFHCSECGAEVPGDSLCCPRCGAKFDEDDEVVIVKDAKEAEEAAKNVTPKENEEEKKE